MDVSQGQLIVGDSAVITCSSIIQASLEWLDSEGRVVASVNAQKQLELMFIPVNDSLHNTQYTCRITQGGVVERRVDVSITSMLELHCLCNIIRTVVRIVGMGRMSHICNTKCSRL